MKKSAFWWCLRVTLIFVSLEASAKEIYSDLCIVPIENPVETGPSQFGEAVCQQRFTMPESQVFHFRIAKNSNEPAGVVNLVCDYYGGYQVNNRDLVYAIEGKGIGSFSSNSGTGLIQGEFLNPGDNEFVLTITNKKDYRKELRFIINKPTNVQKP